MAPLTLPALSQTSAGQTEAPQQRLCTKRLHRSPWLFSSEPSNLRRLRAVGRVHCPSFRHVKKLRGEKRVSSAPAGSFRIKIQGQAY